MLFRNGKQTSRFDLAKTKPIYYQLTRGRTQTRLSIFIIIIKTITKFSCLFCCIFFKTIVGIISKLLIAPWATERRKLLNPYGGDEHTERKTSYLMGGSVIFFSPKGLPTVQYSVIVYFEAHVNIIINRY